MEKDHKELWEQINTLKEKTYKQETQIEVLKEKVEEEKNKKEKSDGTVRWALGILFTIVMGVTSWINNTSESVTRYDERIQTIRQMQDSERSRLTEVSEDVVTVQDWVEENFVKK